MKWSVPGTKFKSFSHLSFEQHCREWAESIEGYRYLEGAPNAVAVRQEELVCDPDGVMDKVCRLAGLRPSERCANFVRHTLIHTLDETTQRDVDVEKLVSARVPAYLAWTPEQRQTFKGICSGAMKEAGYEVLF